MYVPRTGLRIRCLKGVDPEVRRACIEFGKWLRQNYNFPIRVVIYLKPDYQIKNQEGEMVSATFFAPYCKEEEPFIKISTGDYDELVTKWGEDDALAAYLNSIAHEIIHYIQWLDDRPLSEREANTKGKQIVRKYAQTREHP